MRIEDMPSCGALSNAPALRREVMKALGTAQVNSRASPSSETATVLAAFLRACADLCEPTVPKKGKRNDAS